MSDMLVALNTFVRVADGLSFSRLAELTGTSHTTVARRMDQLERHFGARLLNRTTRRLALTPEGVRLLDHARAVLEAMERAEGEFSEATGVCGTVRVGVTTALGLYYAERLHILTDRHPGLRIEFAVADWQSGLLESGVDLALRVGAPAPEALTTMHLGEIQRVLVASPDYLEKHGEPDTVDALMGHDCIAYGYGPAPTVWELGSKQLRVSSRFRANSSEAVYRAVMHGIGIALLPEIQVRDALRSGALSPILSKVEIAPLHLSIEHRFTHTRVPSQVRLAQAFLVDTFPATDPNTGRK